MRLLQWTLLGRSTLRSKWLRTASNNLISITMKSSPDWNDNLLHCFKNVVTLLRVMDSETKLLQFQLKRIREVIDTAEHLDYTSYCTLHLWQVFYEYQRQLNNSLHKGRQSWVWRTTVHRLLRPRIVHHFTTWKRGTPYCIPIWLGTHPPHHKVNVSMMKYAVILKRKKKGNVISTKRLNFFSLEDASHYERNIKDHDPKVISTELIPILSWRQSSQH